MSTREGDSKKGIREALRNLGEEPFLAIAKGLGLAPEGGRLRCPFEHCALDGPARAKTAVIHAAPEPQFYCRTCHSTGTLLDLLQVSFGWPLERAEEHVLALPGADRPQPQLRLISSGDEADKLSRDDAQALWDGMAKDDELGRAFLAKLGLEAAADSGQVRFATESHPDRTIARYARDGYRIAVAVRDLSGDVRGLQLRRARESTSRDPDVRTVKGSSLKRAYFGEPQAVQGQPMLAVVEGLDNALALNSWVDGYPGMAVVGVAIQSGVAGLAAELDAAGISMAGKLVVLFPENDAPTNVSQREFRRLGQLLQERGAKWLLSPHELEFRGLAEWRRARPEVVFPPPAVDRLITPEPGDESPREHKLVLAKDSAVRVPARITVERYAKNFGTLNALLDDPVTREIIAGPGELSWCEMTWSARLGERPLAKHDISAIRLGIEMQYRTPDGKPLQFTATDIADALEMLARNRKSVHPVRAWLCGLESDGRKLLEADLPAVLGHAGDSVEAAMLRRWMVAAVARAMEPGCKVDNVLILVGEQGDKKSSFFRAVGGDWFTDSPVHIGDKDGKMIMRKKWIIEWAELEALRRAKDNNATKGFVTAQIDLFRPPYGKDLVEAPRHCVIVGTSNPEDLFNDPTGNRRYWPVRVPARVDYRWVRENRAQLFAEAVEIYRGGGADRCEACRDDADERCGAHRWWLTAEEEALRKEVASEHESHDVWTDPIRDYLEREFSFPGREVTTAEVLHGALQKKMDSWSHGDSIRVGNILRRFGWRPVRSSTGSRKRVYVRAP